jgi:tRNA dimethylallyltransferase
MEQRIIAIVGPTASGKSNLAVKIAHILGSPIISVDSRQVYRGLDIGSGKVPGDKKPYLNSRSQINSYMHKGIVHYGIDIVSPTRQYSVAQFQKYATKVIKKLHQQEIIPLLCGGTGHWMDAVVYQQLLPSIKPNSKLRARLERSATEKLYAQLQTQDPRRAATIDRNNRRRLIRALEIVMSSGQPVPELHANSPFQVLWIGMEVSPQKLALKIKQRLAIRLRQGMVAEVRRLHRQGISWKRLEQFGLEYAYCARYLQGQLDRTQLEQYLYQAIKQYAKRQMTWFKRNHDIHWISTKEKALALVEQFVQKRA